MPIGLEGLVSAGLGAVFQLLPLGNRPLQITWAAAFGLGVLSWLVFRATLSLLATHQAGSTSGQSQGRLDALFALAAALTGTLGPALLAQGSRPGGDSVAAALAVGTLTVGLGVFQFQGRTPILLGMLWALTALESRSAALSTAATLAVVLGLRRSPVTRKATLGLFFGAGLVLCLPAVLAFKLMSSDGLEAGLALASISVSMPELGAIQPSAALARWLSQVTWPWCALALIGLSLGTLKKPTRALTLPLLMLIACDTLLGPSNLQPTERDPLGPIRILALFPLAIGGALGMRIAVDALLRAKIPFARASAALILVCGFALALAATEDAIRRVDAEEHWGPELWTDEALLSLPPQAALLLHSDALIMRLLSVQKSQGRRADLLLLPVPLLAIDPTRAQHLARSPGVAPLIRDLLLSGRPGEFALTRLADTRPLFAEPDPSWDRRLLRHFAPRPFLAQIAPHPLGRSDRSPALAQADRVLARINLALEGSSDAEPGTRALLATELTQRAFLLGALGDRKEAEKVSAQLVKLRESAQAIRHLQFVATDPDPKADRGSIDLKSTKSTPRNSLAAR